MARVSPPSKARAHAKKTARRKATVARDAKRDIKSHQNSRVKSVELGDSHGVDFHGRQANGARMGQQIARSQRKRSYRRSVNKTLTPIEQLVELAKIRRGKAGGMKAPNPGEGMTASRKRNKVEIGDAATVSKGAVASFHARGMNRARRRGKRGVLTGFHARGLARSRKPKGIGTPKRFGKYELEPLDQAMRKARVG